jgi:predicted MFS family arabinose efflux permease
MADRFGPRRMAICGMVLACPLALLLGTVGGHVWYGVALLVLMSVGVEFSFVSALPIITELDPGARAAAIGLATVVITVARAASSAISGFVYVHAGIGVTGVVGSVAFALAAFALWTVVEPARIP